MDVSYYSNRLFDGIGEQALADLALAPKSKSFAPCEVIFKEGDPGDTVFLLTQGAVRISKTGRGREQETLETIRPGDYFGEVALLDGRPRSARCTAIESAEVGCIDESTFNHLLTSIPQIAVNISRFTVDRLRHTDQQFIEQLMEGERLSLLGRMVGSIVHDFRNPMATLLMGTSYLQTHGDNPRFHKLGNTMERSVNRMILMTQELLDYSKGISKANLECISMAKLFEAVDEEALCNLEGSKIEVVKAIDYKGELVVDRHRLERVLLNLIKNAVEAMPDGGTLTISSTQRGSNIQIEVSDTGCGMPAEVAQRAFEPFMTHGKSNGTGLGMAIAKSAVEAHQGEIWLESSPGEGTTVFVSLPTASS